MIDLDHFVEVPIIDAFSKYDDVLKNLSFGVDDEQYLYLLLFDDVLPVM